MMYDVVSGRNHRFQNISKIKELQCVSAPMHPASNRLAHLQCLIRVELRPPHQKSPYNAFPVLYFPKRGRPYQIKYIAVPLFSSKHYPRSCRSSSLPITVRSPARFPNRLCNRQRRGTGFNRKKAQPFEPHPLRSCVKKLCFWLPAPYFKSFMATASISENSWFSPAMAQMNV